MSVDHSESAARADAMATLERELKRARAGERSMSRLVVAFAVLSTLATASFWFAGFKYGEAKDELERMQRTASFAGIECVCTLDACTCEVGR